MRIGTLVAGVLAMAAGFGLAAIVIGWPALVVGGPIVFGGAVVVLVIWLTGMQQRHNREHRYANADKYGRLDPHHGYVAYDGGFDDAYDDRSTWHTGYDAWSPNNDEETVDSDYAWVGHASDDRPAEGGGSADSGYSGSSSSDSGSSDSSSSDSGSSSSSSD